ncbi:MAG TPA: NAD(P)/FAD-dependent oxidoreductase [Methylomirabilota bacterium]|nr:NAD(P)/FAD-dependent oxidoreductase [Methylomirabilota bacterium]
MNGQSVSEKPVIVIGAGPSGLTAAYELTKHQLHPIVIEKGDKVGGLARTENYKGFHFDIGGHRFFTKVAEVNKIWHELLGDDFLRRPRLSRIYYAGTFFDYPLKPLNAFKGLGIFESLLILMSYLWWQVFPYRQEETFEQWVTNRFGKRLFQTFFKSYTEKVWGIPCSELKAEWAAQRIKDLSLRSAVLSMFVKPQKTIKTLIDSFEYPRLGPGMMWNAVKERIEQGGGTVRLNSNIIKVRRNGNRIDSVVLSNNGHTETLEGSEFISTMPVTEFLTKLDPPSPPAVLHAVSKLKYRDFLTVCLIVNKPDLFPDNWIYIHDPAVKVGRIQNFKNWSPSMVPDSTKTSLGLEYFCTEGDELWDTSDRDLIELGKQELDRIGLASYSDVEDGCVVRVPKAYPMYDSYYREYLDIVKEFAAGVENFQTIGRNGLHRYNNQDHAMLTGMLAVRNLVFGEKNDLWNVNTDQEYHEEIRGEVETDNTEEVLKEAVSRAFPKLDRVALGLSLGTVSSILLFVVTLFLVLKGGDIVGPNLVLLANYFPGYTVTASGSVLGLTYGFVTGFLGGWSFAFLRNAVVFLYIAIIHRRAEWALLRELLKYF